MTRAKSILGAALLAAAAGAGCKTAPAKSAPPPAEPAAAAPAPAPAPVAPPQPGEASWEGVLQSEESRIRIKEEEKQTASASHVRIGKDYYQALDFEKAEINLRKAVELDPRNEEAARLLNDVQLALGRARMGDEGEVTRRLIDEVIVKTQQAQIEVEAYYQRGVKLFEEGKYDEAEAEFRYILEVVKWFPYHIELESRRTQALAMLEKTQEARKADQLQRESETRERARVTSLSEEGRRKVEEERRLEMLFEQARLEFEQERYGNAERICDKILYLNPTIAEVQDLKTIARQARHAQAQREGLTLYVENWKRVFEHLDVASLVQPQIVRWPDRDTWEFIKKRKPSSLSTVEENLTPEEEAIAQKLKSFKVTLDFADTPLPEVIDFLRDLTQINMLIDTQAVTTPEDVRVHLKVTDLILESALRLILGPKDLAYVIQEGVVKITTKEKVGTLTKLELYDVQDLTGTIQDFPGVDINLNPSTTSGVTALAAPAESRGIPIEDLVELIRNNIAKDTWDSGDSSITNSNGILIIRNVPDVHRKIIAFLSEVRKSTGMLVSVETRFLRVQDNFLEELGIDYRDLRDATGPILDDFNPPLTDPPPFTPGGNQGTNPAPAPPNVTAGIIGSFGDNIQRDMAARVEHLLDTDTLVTSFYNSVFSNTGGINLTYTLLDDISLEAIVRAVKKSERSHELLVPKLTLFNTQRANMLISNQVAYIRDFDIEVATGFGLPDPIVDVVQDGISLDVRPIVSADRRFITLELRPTVARLVSLPPNLPFILTPITAGGGLTVRIETPVLRVERVRTTVTIPDRGVLLLGGLSDYFEIDAESKIPILGDIPIIGMLARRKVKGRQRFQLLILLRARIMILEEDEAKTF